MANMKKGYRIDWKTNTVTMTKKFASEAGEYGTTAYDFLMDVRSKGFHIVVRETEKRKACPTRVTFRQMEQYLSCLTNADEHIAGLHAMVNVAKAQKNTYEPVRKWFLQNYPNFREIPKLNSDLQIVAPHLRLVDEEKGTKVG